MSRIRSLNMDGLLPTWWAKADSSYAYVEFANPSIVANALVLDESQFRGRALSVSRFPSEAL